jgi:hypothetical protein
VPNLSVIGREINPFVYNRKWGSVLTSSLSKSPFSQAKKKKKKKKKKTENATHNPKNKTKQNQEEKEILSDQETQLSLGLLVAEHIILTRRYSSYHFW